MPEILREFLESLSEADADEVNEYLDSNPNAVDNMIAIVAE